MALSIVYLSVTVLSYDMPSESVVVQGIDWTTNVNLQKTWRLSNAILSSETDAFRAIDEATAEATYAGDTTAGAASLTAALR